MAPIHIMASGQMRAKVPGRQASRSLDGAPLGKKVRRARVRVPRRLQYSIRKHVHRADPPVQRRHGRLVPGEAPLQPCAIITIFRKGSSQAASSNLEWAPPLVANRPVLNE